MPPSEKECSSWLILLISGDFFEGLWLCDGQCDTHVYIHVTYIIHSDSVTCPIVMKIYVFMLAAILVNT